MKLSLPVTPLAINQRFGGNKATYKQFGLEGHNGLDLYTGHGQPVYASHDGVANYEVDNSQGHGVDVQGTVEADFGAYTAYPKTRYWHLCDPKKEPQLKSPIYGKKNVPVKAGDLIGYADNTGFSTGDHLHFGLKPQGKNSKGKFYNLVPNNGYKGAVDPLPFFPKVSHTSVPYEEALTSLMRANLPAPVRAMAVAILKVKYSFGDNQKKGSGSDVESVRMSQTYAASVAAILAGVLPLTGFEVADSELVSQNLFNIFTALFGLWVIVRRIQVGDISVLGIRRKK